MDAKTGFFYLFSAVLLYCGLPRDHLAQPGARRAAS